MIRRLTPDDRDLIAEALGWIDKMPRWAKDADRTWGVPSVDEYLSMMEIDPQIDLGIFQDEAMVAEICIALVGNGVYNSHLMMKRGAEVSGVIVAAVSVKDQLFAKYGAKEIWSWALARNHGLQKILTSIGMKRDGVEQYKGSSHGMPLRWLRYSC